MELKMINKWLLSLYNHISWENYFIGCIIWPIYYFIKQFMFLSPILAGMSLRKASNEIKAAFEKEIP